MARRRRIPEFETEITHLGPRGVGVGVAPDGRPVYVRGAPMGSRVKVRVFARKKGLLHARRLVMVRPPAGFAEPRCAVFGLCGGCTLQELSLEAQRDAKQALVLQAAGTAPAVHPLRGPAAGYAYRNKVELSFGTQRYSSEAAHAAGAVIDGRWLGFHAPGRFDRVVDSERCELVGESLNALIATTRREVLREDRLAPHDVRTHEGFWRHLVLRYGVGTGQAYVILVTDEGGDRGATEVAELAEALLKTDLGNDRLAGIAWAVRTEVSDVARGVIRRTWGEPHFSERIGDVAFQLSPFAFFQTNTEAAATLYDTVAEALGAGGTLVDLYCGAGAIGQVLHARFDHVLGIELDPMAVADAIANAERNGIHKTRYLAGKVEDHLEALKGLQGPVRLVVDPPRAGLHPRAVKFLANTVAEVLVYVACNPASLGRDREILEAGGWRMTDLYTVDLFGQTGHVEAVARFVRDAS